MKKPIGMLLILCISLQGRDFPQRKDLGPNPEMRKRMVEPEDKVSSFKKPEFVTKYKEAFKDPKNELVNNKETKKILGTEKPIKYLSHSLFEKWKQASNLLIAAVEADASFEKYVSPLDKHDLVYYATELHNQITLLYKKASLIMEQYPISTYTKPLLKKAKYDENDKISAKRKIKDTVQPLRTITRKVSSIKLNISSIQSNIPTDDKGRKNITAAQEEIYKLAVDLAENIANLAGNLENEVNALN